MAGQRGASQSQVNRDGFAATAESQNASPFLAVLPLEIRKMVYEELWRSYGLRQHIFRRKIDRKFSACRCLVDQGAEDVRFDKFTDMLSNDREVWNTRLKTEWNVHWKCGETGKTGDDGQPIYRDSEHFKNDAPLSIIPILLASKHLYLESTESLYESTTFCFTDTIIAREFLSRQPVDRIQSIEFSIRVKPIITELYYPGPLDGLQPQIAGFPVTAVNNPWENLGRVLCTFTNLRDLRFYLESEDLRPWHSRVAEKKFLARLFQVRARNFALELPELPDEEPSEDPGPRPFARRWELRNPELSETYLTEDTINKAPFTMKRGRRPDNWRAHLTNLGQRGRRGSASRFLAAPPAVGAGPTANVAPF